MGQPQIALHSTLLLTLNGHEAPGNCPLTARCSLSITKVSYTNAIELVDRVRGIETKNGSCPIRGLNWF